jgi:transglutaminase-like putative cysteine protease
MNIPARYCTGYLGDIGVPPSSVPMDFAGWFQAYLGGHWYTFDPRNNVPRIGRVLIGHGREPHPQAWQLRANPSNPYSLFGRGMAKRMIGDSSGGDADIAAARAIRANIADEMAKLGVQ